MSNREVTLSGTVGTRFEKRHAEDVAESVSGVAHVQNNLRVRQGAGAEAGLLSGSGTGIGSSDRRLHHLDRGRRRARRDECERDGRVGRVREAPVEHERVSRARPVRFTEEAPDGAPLVFACLLQARGCGSVGIEGAGGAPGPGLGARSGSVAGASFGLVPGTSKGAWSGEGWARGPGPRDPAAGRRARSAGLAAAASQGSRASQARHGIGRGARQIVRLGAWAARIADAGVVDRVGRAVRSGPGREARPALAAAPRSGCCRPGSGSWAGLPGRAAPKRASAFAGHRRLLRSCGGISKGQPVGRTPVPSSSGVSANGAARRPLLLIRSALTPPAGSRRPSTARHCRGGRSRAPSLPAGCRGRPRPRGPWCGRASRP